MKIIDLLNKAANKEEVPKKIKVLFNVFEYDEDNYNYKNVVEKQDNLLRHLGHYKGTALNEEVEIIEDTPKEDNKIEKLDNKIAYYSGTYETRWSDSEMYIVDKINEIIDKVNGENNED